MSSISLKDFSKRITEILPVMLRSFARRQTGEFYKLRVTFPQFIIMEVLSRQGRSKMSDLARSIGVTTAAMTGITDRLVRDGCVARANDPEDRRVIRIDLTAKGAKIVREITDRRREAILGIFSKVSERDREDYLRVLTNIRDILIKEKGEERQ